LPTAIAPYPIYKKLPAKFPLQEVHKLILAIDLKTDELLQQWKFYWKKLKNQSEETDKVEKGRFVNNSKL
jgi:hypothetical protein